jgi:hypothetical protein
MVAITLAHIFRRILAFSLQFSLPTARGLGTSEAGRPNNFRNSSVLLCTRVIHVDSSLPTASAVSSSAKGVSTAIRRREGLGDEPWVGSKLCVGVLNLKSSLPCELVIRATGSVLSEYCPAD